MSADAVRGGTQAIFSVTNPPQAQDPAARAGKWFFSTSSPASSGAFRMQPSSKQDIVPKGAPTAPVDPKAQAQAMKRRAILAFAPTTSTVLLIIGVGLLLGALLPTLFPMVLPFMLPVITGYLILGSLISSASNLMDLRKNIASLCMVTAVKNAVDQIVEKNKDSCLLRNPNLCAALECLHHAGKLVDFMNQFDPKECGNACALKIINLLGQEGEDLGAAVKAYRS